MKVGIIGTGHVGLVASASFAELGHQVVGTDSDAEKIDLLSRGVAPFHEPGLDDLLKIHGATGRLSFTSATAEAVAGADVVFICVGTPALASGEADLFAVESATRDVATHVDGPLVLVQKSTVPAGTAAR